MALNARYIAKGKRRRADTGEREYVADGRPRALGKRQRSASHRPDALQKLPSAPITLADSNNYRYQRMMTCAAMEPMLLDHCTNEQHENGGSLYGGAMLATPATSPPRGASDSDEGYGGGGSGSGYCGDDDDDDDYWDNNELDPSSEYYEINKLLNQLHHERVMRQRQRQLQQQ
ncbi:hypothetical protein IW140_002656 [Coemansia sp. RSA 1813]|nr:hypothetical protein EV178_000267 [Coemansia sp. RSA 1646]KAJ1772087.1 hypothetical protein LPJ74_001823 [Coemansia sp. RSA 1843]KAJ2215391.1 hypothetical protein EV179_002175 [Coemansia sp. RSA 487]KAJ2569980.1 hypothetical protein IW140_002656 [Coemansia sp. RSA 1813]